MAREVTMPQLGESVTEGTIAQWLVDVGDYVNQYEPLCEVTTDKVNAEVPASFSGKVTEIVAEEGETVEVGALICYLEDQQEGDGQEEQQGKRGPEAERAEKAASATGKAAVAPDKNSMHKRYSPAVLKLAAEHDIDLEQVEGTGKGGRITRKDLRMLIESEHIPQQGPTAKFNETESTPAGRTAQEAVHVGPAEGTHAQPSSQPGDLDIPISPIRRAIANKMVQSKHEVPHAWTMVEVDVTDLVRFRNKAKSEFKQKEGINLTFLPFFIKAAVEALKEYPAINAQWANDSIIQKKDINISIAVSAEEGLYVPVIHNADEKSIFGLAKAIDHLAYKTRAGQLTQEHVEGGTFTINNTGTFGSVQSQPIINYPQAAILSVEAIVQRPVVKDGMIAIRDMVNLCMSLDHRVLDGLTCGRYLQSLKSRLEAMGEETCLY